MIGVVFADETEAKTFHKKVNKMKEDNGMSVTPGEHYPAWYQ